MSKFENRLWSELRRDYGEALAFPAPRQDAPTPIVTALRPSGDLPRAVHAGPLGDLWRHGRLVVVGAVVVGVLAAAGTAVFGPAGNPKYITQFECGVGHHGNVHGLFTTEPVAACAALWPSIYHHSAPALVAWVYETGGAVVVRPADSPPSASGWRRLPKGWTADSAAIELNDQFEDITTGLPSRPCWTASSAAALATSILRGDGLSHWRLRVSVQAPEPGGASSTCLSTIQALGGPELAPHTLLLVERAVRAPAAGRSWYPNRYGRQRRSVEERVNRTLRAGGRCSTAAYAATLWRADARATGIPAGEDIVSAYTPSSQAGARCVRIFVSEPGGGGPANVFAADYP